LRIRWLFMVAWLCMATTGLAHRLSIDWRVEKDTLVISAHTESSPAAGADVEVRSDHDAILATGLLDAQGQWRCPLSPTGGVRIVVNAGLGHRRILQLTQEELQPARAATGMGSAPDTTQSDPGPANGPRVGGSSDGAPGQVVRAVVGLTFILALSASWMSYRNSRRVSAIEKRLDQHASRG